MRIHTAITTHKRPEWCLRLLKQLSKYDVQVSVFHDKCDSDYSQVEKFCKDNGYIYLKSKKHLGKWQFWKLNNLIYQYLDGIDFDYYFQTVDDAILVDNFFERILKYVTSDIDCINPFTLKLHVLGKDLKKEYFANGADCCFLTTKKVMQDFRIDKPLQADVRNESKGSGVGHMFTQKYRELYGNTTLKRLTYAMVYHEGNNGKTVMHDNKRWEKDFIVFSENYKSNIKETDMAYINEILGNGNFYDYLKGKRVAFVGMSDNIKGSGFGKEIDSFDIVYRTNLSEVPEHLQSDYGSRCDVVGVLSKFRNINHKTKWVVNYDRCYSSGNVHIVTKDDRLRIEAQITNTVREESKSPTAGMIAMMVCLRAGVKEFKFFGITGYRNKDKKVANYNENNNHYVSDYIEALNIPNEKMDNADMKNYQYHNFEAQNKFLEMLIKNGLVDIDLKSKKYFNI